MNDLGNIVLLNRLQKEFDYIKQILGAHSVRHTTTRQLFIQAVDEISSNNLFKACELLKDAKKMILKENTVLSIIKNCDEQLDSSKEMKISLPKHLLNSAKVCVKDGDFDKAIEYVDQFKNESTILVHKNRPQQKAPSSQKDHKSDEKQLDEIEKWYCIICGATLEGSGNTCSEKCLLDYRDFQVKSNFSINRDHFSIMGFCNLCGKSHTLKRDQDNNWKIWNRHVECYSNKFAHSDFQIKRRKERERLQIQKEIQKEFDDIVQILNVHLGRYTVTRQKFKQAVDEIKNDNFSKAREFLKDAKKMILEENTALYLIKKCDEQLDSAKEMKISLPKHILNSAKVCVKDGNFDKAIEYVDQFKNESTILVHKNRPQQKAPGSQKDLKSNEKQLGEIEKWYCIICGATLEGRGNTCSEKCLLDYRDFQVESNRSYNRDYFSIMGFCNFCGKTHTLKRDHNGRIWNRHAECYSKSFYSSDFQIKRKKQKEQLQIENINNKSHSNKKLYYKNEMWGNEQKRTKQKSPTKNKIFVDENVINDFNPINFNTNEINDFKIKRQIQKSDIVDKFYKRENQPLTVNDLTNDFGLENKLVIHSYLGQLLASRTIKNIGISDQTKEKYNPVYEYILSNVDTEKINIPKVKEQNTSTEEQKTSAINSKDIEKFLFKQGIIINHNYIIDNPYDSINPRLKEKIQLLNQNIDPDVDDFIKLSVGGNDILSNKKLHELQKEVPDFVNSWVESSFPHNKSMQAPTLRWILRGLKLDYALKKVATDWSRFYGHTHNKQKILALDEIELIECDKQLKESPNSEDVLSFKAMVLYDLGRRDEALTVCKELIYINPENEEVLILKGTILHELNQNDKALNICEKLIEINSENKDVFGLKAEILYDMNQSNSLSLVENVSNDSETIEKKQIQVLIEKLRSDDEILNLQVSSDLLKWGESALEALIEALEDEDHHFQLQIVSILGRIGNPVATVSLVKLSDKTYDPLRGSIAIALGKIGCPLSIECLVSLLEDNNRHVKKKAADSLVKIGKPTLNILIEKKNGAKPDIKSTIDAVIKRITLK